MKKALFFPCFVLGLLPTVTQAQHAHSPYAAHQAREIKALSAEEVEGYLNGDGLGMALPAELNGYPGPRHALELAEELELGEKQVTAVRRIHDSMKARAVELGTQIVQLERRLDQEFAKGSITFAVLESLTDEIAQLQGRLRAAHLRAHLEMADVLTDAQREEYDRLRGYAGHH
jgi:Spy/CpxP family protein refolding chaperone